MSVLLDDLRRHIDHGRMTRYAIWMATGVDQAQLSRLMAGSGGLSVESLELVADALGLEIVIRPKRRRGR